MNLAAGTALLLAMVLLEILYLKFVQKEDIPWNEVIFNLNSGHVLLWVCRGLEIAGFHYILQYCSLGWVGNWPIAAQWIFGFLAWDFCFYWLHRLHHKFPLLWSVHVVHHEGEHFSLSLGIRNSWYSSLTSFPFFIVLAVLGVPLEIFIVSSSVHYFIQFYNHNRVVGKSGWLEHILVTPSHHRVHHGSNPEYRDKNCAGTFVIWDKLFGTFQEERDDIVIVYGVKNSVKTQNPFWANMIPVFKYLNIPVPQFFNSSKKKYQFNDFFIASGGLVLFGMLLFYIYQEDFYTVAPKFFLFLLLLLSTIAMAGLFEGYAWGIVSWGILSLFGNFLYVVYFTKTNPAFILLSVLFACHGVLTILKSLKQKMIIS